MKNLTIRGILVDTRKGISPVKFEYNTYEDITNLLKCKWITCVSRLIGGKIVNVYCDEEALLKPAREPAIITRNKSTREIVEVLYGNCLLILHDKDGDIKSLPFSYYDPILLTQASITEGLNTYQVLQAEM